MGAPGEVLIVVVRLFEDCVIMTTSVTVSRNQFYVVDCALELRAPDVSVHGIVDTHISESQKEVGSRLAQSLQAREAVP